MGIPQTFQNYVTNPKTVPNGLGAELRRNLITNPAMARATSPVVVRTNEIRNPSFEAGSPSFDWPTGPYAFVAKDATGAQSGMSAVKVIPTGTGAVPADSYIGSLEPRSITAISNGTSITVSATLTVPQAQLGTDGLGGGLFRPRALYLFTRAGGSGSYTSAFQQAPNTPGTYRLTATLPIATGTNVEYFIRLMNGSPNPNDVVYWDDVLVQRTSTNGESLEYFDGSSPIFNNDDATRIHSWTGTVHGSTSNESVYNVTNYTNTGLARCRWTAKRTFTTDGCMGITYTGSAATLTAGPSTTVTLPAATQYTFSAYYYKTTGGANAALQVSGPGMTTVTSAAVGVTGSWARGTVTFTTVTAGVYTLSLLNSGAVTDTTPASNTDAWQLETGATATSFFSGATNAQNLSYSWLGTTNNSASVETGLAMPGYVAANASITAAMVSGQYRLGVIPNSASTDSKAYVVGGPGALRLGFTPGKSYFIRGTLTQTAALTGTPSTTNTRNMTFYTKAGAASVLEVRSDTSTNAAGTYEHTMFVTVPTDATEAYLSVNNGHPTGGGTTFWSNIMVTEAMYDGVVDALVDNGDLTQFGPSSNATLSTNTVGNIVWATLTPSTASNSSFARWTGAALLQPGKTYQLAWAIRRPAVLTTTANANARRPAVVITSPSTGTVVTLGTQAPNTATTNTYTMTFTTPVDMTAAEIQLWNGHSTGGGVVQYNDVILKDTTAPTFAQTYFDGSNAPVYANRVSRWLGAPNASISQFLFRGLWIEANTSVSPPRLMFTAAGLGLNAVSKVTIKRLAGEDTMPVAGWIDRNVLDIGVGTDWLVPLNVNTEYQLWVNGSQIDSETIMFTSACGWVADPLTPGAAMPVWTTPQGTALQLTKAAMEEKQYSSEYTTEKIIGTPWPMARAGQRSRLQEINLSVQAPANVTSDQFYEMIKDSPILCFRTHPSWGNMPPVVYVACNVTERPVNRATGGQFTEWDVKGDVVMPVSRGPVVAGVTHAEVQLALTGRTHQSIKDVSSGKRWVDILADPLSLGG